MRQAYKCHAWGSVKDRTDPDSCTLANRARHRACPGPPRPRRYHAHVASSHPRPEANVPDDLLLKVTPPRVPRHLVTRARLQAEHEPWASHPLVLVRAPAGYGKTSLLAQWRREHLARGRVVAWVMAQALDYEARFVAALAYAVRVGAGRPGFGATLAETAGRNPLEAVTRWLAELAQMAWDTVLIVDEGERLPEASRALLGYLVRNAPANLRVVVAARADDAGGLKELIDPGLCAELGPAQLCFSLEDTLELVRSRFGAGVSRDAAARLHDVAEGWPLGLQLALAAAFAAPDPARHIAELAAHGGALRERFVELLLAKLAPPDVDFLTRVSILDHLHPELCARVTLDETAANRLARLARDTPVFAAGESGEWLRLHTLAREELRRRFVQLPANEQAALHTRASEGLAQRGLLPAAARHALAAGRREVAYDLAERSLYGSLMSQGNQGAVLEWLAHMPQDEVDRRPRLLLAAAWSLALSDRHEQAQHYVARILAQRAADDELRCECALIAGGAALWADDPDRFAALHDPWAQSPPLRDLQLLRVHANRMAYRTLIDGEPGLARMRLQRVPAAMETGARTDYLDRWGDFIQGLSYLWEGQVRLSAENLQVRLALAERQFGRRHPLSCMLAAILATALWECGLPDQAAAVMANRLDVLEHSGTPEAVLLGFRTLARMAAAEGSEHRALELLAALDAMGQSRGLLRLRLISLAEQVRLHARRYRADTCRSLCAQMDGLLAQAAPAHGPIWLRQSRLLADVAHAHAALAAQQWAAAEAAFARADAGAQAVRMGRLHIEMLALRAFVRHRQGQPAQDLLREAVDLADVYGLQKVFDDAHPELGAWARAAAPRPDAAAPPPPAAATSLPEREAATASMALTPKEREVLELLARNLSNKEIGRVLQVGEETVKWHVKNLFAKLDVGARKQVVQRARLLGLLAG